VGKALENAVPRDHNEAFGGSMTRSSALLAVLLVASLAPAGPALGQSTEESQAEETLSAIVRVKTRIPREGRSAATLGTEREGTGVLVREGYVATIGYLTIEAEAIEVTAADGKTVPATLAGYDHASGFGVLKLLAPIAGKPLPLGDSAALEERDPVLVAPYGGRDALSIVSVVSRRPFSGSWEYQVDSAIFTYPPVQNWSGAALIGKKGELLGLGSLIVADAVTPGTQSPGNLFVPVDLLKAILDDLIERGRAPGPARPWLGLYSEELRGRIFVLRVSPDSPAERAGVKSGDIVLGVGDKEVTTLADFYGKVWARGAAGIDVPLRVLQGMQVKELKIRSADRADYLRARPNY
jgi:S1-C subfamily serine protease